MIRVKPAKNYSAKVLAEAAVGFLPRIASDVEAEEILYRCQIGSLHPFAETVLPDAGLIGGWEPSLARVFLHFIEGPLV